MKLLYLFVFFVIPVFAGHSFASDQKPIQEKSEGLANTAAKVTEHIYSENPLDLTIATLPANYHGHDPEDLYRRLNARKGREAKGEFETTEAYRARVQSEATKPILGTLNTSSIFACEIATRMATYDADRQVMHVTTSLFHVFEGLMGKANKEKRSLVCKRISKRDSYIGTNAYGASVEVTKSTHYEYGLAVGNYFHFPIRTEQFKSLGSYEQELFAFDLKMDPTTAMKTKENLRLLAIFKLQPPFTLEGSLYLKPTFDSPLEFFTWYLYINAELLEILLYDAKTGEIFDRLKPS